MKKDLLTQDIVHYKKILQKLNHYTLNLNASDNVDIDIWKSDISILELQSQIVTLARALEKEDFIDNEKIATAVVRTICSEFLEQLIQPLLEKQINEKLLFINNQLTDITLTQDNILGDDLVMKYNEIEYIEERLSYQSLSPLLLFEDFISFFNINLLVDKKTNKFIYRFTSDTPISHLHEESKKWYVADTFYEMCEHFSKVLMNGVMKYIVNQLKSTSNSLIIDINNFIDIRIVNSLKTPSEIYNYLESINIAKMNLPLSYLYLLLNYHDFYILNDMNIMNEIKQNLLRKKTENKNGYEYYFILRVLIDLLNKNGAN